MRCSQALAGLTLLLFAGVLFVATGCKQESPPEPGGEKQSAYQEVTVEISGMT